MMRVACIRRSDKSTQIALPPRCIGMGEKVAEDRSRIGDGPMGYEEHPVLHHGRAASQRDESSRLVKAHDENISLRDSAWHRELMLIQPCVNPSLFQQFSMPTALHYSPFWTTRILSAFRIVESRCAMMIEVLAARAVSSACCIAASDSESKWAVASSRITMSGALRSRRAIAMRCFSPPEKRYPLADDSIQLVGQGFNKVQNLRIAQCTSDLFIRCIRLGVEQVRSNSVVK